MNELLYTEGNLPYIPWNQLNQPGIRFEFRNKLKENHMQDWSHPWDQLKWLSPVVNWCGYQLWTQPLCHPGHRTATCQPSHNTLPSLPSPSHKGVLCNIPMCSKSLLRQRFSTWGSGPLWSWNFILERLHDQTPPTAAIIHHLWCPLEPLAAGRVFLLYTSCTYFLVLIFLNHFKPVIYHSKPVTTILYGHLVFMFTNIWENYFK